ncbi:hypothetical protein FISHEDRAFT_72287 [Fistulina hepatica ATCC 64428]|uniref:Extracellular membrane protein CFEM domain-containing protein n=1 Tax=Fistulina hepatica ATCC 64428 TaxID=1128425 RepID=A0A0D7AE92_9AGAR|nr:hypothetical protein FISHEDRAFT_72287 [Fistulina hepatica ATCC 64428]
MAFSHIVAFSAFFALVSSLASPSVVRDILSRQAYSSDIPTACESQCSTFIDASYSCTTDLSCLCTDSNAASLQECMNCIVELYPTAAEAEAAQSVLDEFSYECEGYAAGSDVLTVTVVATGTALGSNVGILATDTLYPSGLYGSEISSSGVATETTAVLATTVAESTTAAQTEHSAEASATTDKATTATVATTADSSSSSSSSNPLAKSSGASRAGAGFGLLVGGVAACLLFA